MDSRTTSRSAMPSTVMPNSVSRPKARFIYGNVRQARRAGKWQPLFRDSELVEKRPQRGGPLRVARGIRMQHVGKFLLLARAGPIVEERPCVAEADLWIVLERLLIEGVQLANL